MTDPFEHVGIVALLGYYADPGDRPCPFSNPEAAIVVCLAECGCVAGTPEHDDARFDVASMANAIFEVGTCAD